MKTIITTAALLSAILMPAVSEARTCHEPRRSSGVTFYFGTSSPQRYHYAPRYVAPAPRYYRPAPVYYSSHPQTVVITHRTVHAAQRQLQRMGYHCGPADGVFGRDTRAAVRAFQYDHGLRPTGTLNTATLRRLGLC
ncbi:MAG: peptidoglycan-binding protein [Candidatus Methylacidiphilales bacterium]